MLIQDAAEFVMVFVGSIVDYVDVELAYVEVRGGEPVPKEEPASCDVRFNGLEALRKDFGDKPSLLLIAQIREPVHLVVDRLVLEAQLIDLLRFLVIQRVVAEADSNVAKYVERLAHNFAVRKLECWQLFVGHLVFHQRPVLHEHSFVFELVAGVSK